MFTARYGLYPCIQHTSLSVLKELVSLLGFGHVEGKPVRRILNVVGGLMLIANRNRNDVCFFWLLSWWRHQHQVASTTKCNNVNKIPNTAFKMQHDTSWSLFHTVQSVKFHFSSRSGYLPLCFNKMGKLTI